MALTNYQYEYLQEEQSDIKRFQQRFEAHITESREYKHSVRQPLDYQYKLGTASYNMDYRVEPCVAIHLPKVQFDRLMDDQHRMDRWREEAEYAKGFMKRHIADERVRDTNPTVEKAYQKYLMLLELCRS